MPLPWSSNCGWWKRGWLPSLRQLSLRDCAVEKRLVDDRVRLRRIPEDGHAVLRHAELGQHREEAGAAVLGVLAGVVGHAERRARRRARKDERQAGECQDRSDPPHASYLGRSAASVNYCFE